MQSAPGAPSFRTLSDLTFHVNFSQPSQPLHSEDEEMEERKEGDQGQLKVVSDQLT